MRSKPHLPKWVDRILFLLRVISVVAVIYGFYAQVNEPLFSKSIYKALVII